MPSISRSLLSPAMVKNCFLAILLLLALPQETKAPQQLWIAQASPEHRPEAAVMMSFLFCFILKCADVAHPALLHLLREWTEEPKSSKNIKVRISVILPALLSPPHPHLPWVPLSQTPAVASQSQRSSLIITFAGMWIGHLTFHLHRQLEGCPERRSVRHPW